MNSWIFILLISCLCGNSRGRGAWNMGCGRNNSCNDCLDDAKDGCGIPEAWRRTEDCECNNNDWGNDKDCDCDKRDREKADDCGCDNNRDRDNDCGCDNNRGKDNDCGCNQEYDRDNDCDHDHNHERDCECDKHSGQKRMTPPPIRSNYNR